MRKDTFSYGVVDEWRRVSDHIAGAEAMGNFKRRLY